jgi:hypothetical protein
MRLSELETGQEVEIKVYSVPDGWHWIPGRVADPYSNPPFIEFSDGSQIQPKASRIRLAKKGE